MPKIERSLVNFSARWLFSSEEKVRTGSAPALALEDIERLDGTLFMRVAELTFDRLGMDEGEKVGLWVSRIISRLSTG